MTGIQRARQAFYDCSSANSMKDVAFIVNVEPVQEGLSKRLKEHVNQIDWARVIGYIDVSRRSNTSAGIVICDTKAYFFGFPMKPRKIWYDEIEKVEVKKSKGECVGIRLRQSRGSDFTWENDAIDSASLAALFDALRQLRVEACDAYREANLDARAAGASFEEAAGFVTSNKGTTNKIFDEERFHSRQGHGFAAERANDLEDRLHGKKARIVGDDNVKNGPDRAIANPDGTTT